jgi:hypothetical protein
MKVFSLLKFKKKLKIIKVEFNLTNLLSIQAFFPTKQLMLPKYIHSTPVGILKNFLAFYQHFLHTHLWVNVFSLI